MKRSVVAFQFIFLFSVGCFVSSNLIGSSVIDDYSLRDLDLEGPLFATVDRTKTSAGRQVLQEMLKKPLSDYQLLKKRQDVIKKLASDISLRKKIQSLLAAFHQHEEYLTLHDDPATRAVMNHMIKNFYFKMDFLQGFNDSSLALDILHLYEKIMLFSPIAEHLLLHFAKDSLSHSHGEHSHKCKHHHHGHTHGHSHAHKHHDDHVCAVSLFEKIFKSCGLSKEAIGKAMWGVIVTHFLMHALSVKEMVEHVQSKNRVINHLHQMLAHIKCCVSAFLEITSVIRSNDMLTKGFQIDQFSFDQETDSFMKTIKTLQDGSFDEANEIGFFFLVGETLAGYKQVEASFDCFEEMTSFIGKIDAFVSLAQLYDDYSKDGKSCYVKFVESNQPLIDFTGVWHPLLDENHVVCNDVCFGEKSHQHAIITGPNKAGKSTLIKTVAFNVLLAQVGGFAFARQARMTPFSKIVTYINVSDDLCNDQSKFAAELLRADQCMSNLKELDSKAFGLCILDDSLFSSTNHEQTSHAAYSFVESIGRLPGVISLTATHLPVLTDLKEKTNGKFTNYRIKLQERDSGSFESSFQLEEGISDVKNTLSLVQAQGYTTYSGT